MRAAKRRKRLNRSIGPPPPGVELPAVAAASSYVGSPEHKAGPSFAGQPRPRADASICDERLTQDEVTRWLRTAINRGVFGGFWEGAFPRYVWYKLGPTVYEARLINRGTGEYKGYPLEEDEWPADIADLYE